MNYKMILYILGTIFKIVSYLLLLPLLISIIDKDGATLGFLLPIAMFFIVGILTTIKPPKDRTIYIKESLIIVALSWLLISIVGALPYFISGTLPNFVDAIFESVSGFSTTGASVIQDIESIPRSIVFWRSFTSWIGGMGVLIFVLALLPNAKKGFAMQIYRAETTGPRVNNVRASLSITSRILYIVYISLTIFEALLLLIGGVDIFTSLNIAFSTAATGGFSVFNSSIAGFSSGYIEGVVSLFMIFFSINFNIFYLILIGKIIQAIKNEELILFFGVLFVSIVLVSINIMHLYESFGRALLDSTFQVISFISSTGFTTTNISLWPTFSQSILLILAFLGGCSGSTCGGLKLSRVLILSKSTFYNNRTIINPRHIDTIKIDGKSIENDVISSTRAYFVLFISIMIFSMLVLSLLFSMSESLELTIICFNNVGTPLSESLKNFVALPDWSKLFLSSLMLLGRVEILPILLLFYPRSWKRY